MVPTRAKAAMLAALFALAACGGGGDSAAPLASGGGGGGSAPVPSPAPAPGPAPAPAPASSVVVADTSSTARMVAVLGDGSQVAAWSDASGVFAQRFTATGAAGAKVQLATSGKFDGIAALSGGGYAVEFETTDAVFVQVVNAAGTPLSSPVTVTTAAQVAGVPTGYSDSFSLVGGAGVLAAADGGFIAGYFRQSQPHGSIDAPYDLLEQKYDSGGNAAGTAQPVSFAYMSTSETSGTALPTGGFAFAWVGRYVNTQVGVYGNSLDWLGTYGAPQENPGSGNRVVAGLQNGRIVTAWNEGGVVKGQVFHLNGSVSTDTGVITFAGVTGQPHLVSLPGNRFLLTWGGNQAQVFDANGQPVSAAFTIASENVAVVSGTQIVALAQEGAQLVAHYYAI